MRRHGLDLVIADVRLPDGLFSDWLAEHRASWKTPFMALASIEDAEALRRCFDLGAADYLVKPFRRRQLLDKVQKVLESKFRDQHVQVIDRGLRLNLSQLMLESHSGASVELTPKELKILLCLSEKKPQWVLREEIVQQVWPKTHVSEKTLDVHLVKLRKKLGAFRLAIEYRSPLGYRVGQSESKSAAR